MIGTPLRSAGLVLAAVLLASCSKNEAPAPKGAPAAVPVTVLEVSSREVPVAFESVGRTEGSREVQVRARVAGILEAQLFTEGDRVKAGAPLFRIERAPFEVDLAQQKAALAQERARGELAQQEVERLQRLTDRRAISQKEADQAASTLRQSQSAAQMAEARVRQAELNLSYTSVEAPIEGITGRALQSVGSLLSPTGDASLLTTITRTDPLWVRFSVSDAEFARLRARGVKNPEVRLEAADGTPFPAAGRINFASSTVDASLGTVQMRAEFPNPKLELLPGQFVRVRVIAGNQPAIVVPQGAVLQNQSGRFVWVAGPENKALQRPIRVGSWVGRDWVVLDGLKDGDKVIVDNLVRLRPDTAVELKPAAKPEAKKGEGKK